jgi:hypothetical protein
MAFDDDDEGTDEVGRKTTSFMSCMTVITSLLSTLAMMMVLFGGSIMSLIGGMIHVTGNAPNANAPQVMWYADGDGDGFGYGVPLSFGQPGPGFARQPGDCKDFDAAVHPGAREICNDEDDDCDGQVDEGLPIQTWYVDYDYDGYGQQDHAKVECRKPVSQVTGYAILVGDCDTFGALKHPGAAEICNNQDDDCDGLIDEGLLATTWYLDSDRDGYGYSKSAGLTTCGRPDATRGWVSVGGDCDDWDRDIYPGAWDKAGDYRDSNCDGEGGL